MLSVVGFRPGALTVSTLGKEPNHMDSTSPPSAITPDAAVQAGRGSFREYLSFRLGAEQYAIDILRVQEIRGYERPTRLAGAPPFVLGVLNLRGLVVPVVDLRLKLGSPAPAYDASTVTIVLNIGSRVVGAVVDSVSDVVELPAGDLLEPPEFSAETDARYVTGLGRKRIGEQDTLLIVVDIERLMSDESIGLASAASLH